MKLYLDDVRDLPHDYDVLVRDAQTCIDLLKTGLITHVSLDHDLGTEMTGYDVAKFLEQAAFEKRIPQLTWNVHSANPVGAKQMSRALENAEYYWGR